MVFFGGSIVSFGSFALVVLVEVTRLRCAWGACLVGMVTVGSGVTTAGMGFGWVLGATVLTAFDAIRLAASA